MPRPLRLQVPGGIFHITLRGNNRRRIFDDATDHHRYLQERQQGFREHACSLLAYALMSNHVHLLLQDHQGTLSRLMQVLNARYTRYFNRRHQCIGHLYQGRFFSRLVDRDEYLLEVSRYVHLNPVRAGMVRRPEEYSWSSYRAYVGLASRQATLVEPQLVWSLMSQDSAEQPSLYRAFVDAMTPQQLPVWERRLRRLKLIPSQKVSGTFPASKSV